MSIINKLSELISRKTDLAYGLEITDSSVRLAAVPKKGGSAAPKVLYEHHIDYTPDSLHAINVGDDMKKALQHISRHYGIAGAHVGIPERHFFFRCIKTPKMTGPKAKNGLHQIIDDYLTTEVVLPRSDVVCEYEVVAEEGDHWFVALAVVPKFVVRRYFSLLEMARIKPLSIEANIQAMHRSCIEDLAKDLSLVVRVERGVAHAAIVGTGAVFFDRDYVLPDSDPEHKFLSNELQRFYRDWVTVPYRNEIERTPVTSVVLFGGNEDLILLQAEIEQRLRLPVRLTRPVITHIESQHEVPAVHGEQMHRFSGAIGLALQGR